MRAATGVPGWKELCMLSVVIDVHDRLYVVCVLDETGSVLREHTILGEPIVVVDGSVCQVAHIR